MEIRRYITIALKWWWLVVISVGIFGFAAYIYSDSQPQIYRAAAKLLIDIAPGSDTGGSDYATFLFEQHLALTYTELLQTRTVREQAVEALADPVARQELEDKFSSTTGTENGGVEASLNEFIPVNITADALLSKVGVSTLNETQILVVTVNDKDPQKAAIIANVVSKVFIDQNQGWQNARFAQSITNREIFREELRNQINSVETELNTLETIENKTAEEKAKESELTTQLRELQIAFTQAVNQLEDLREQQAIGTNNLVLIEEARATNTPISPNVSRTTLLGIAAGGLLAVGFVLLKENLDDSIKSPDEVLEDTNLSTLGVIAHIQGNNQLVTQHTPRAPVSEAFRALRTNLGFSSIDGELRSMLVTSATPSEGKSTIAANLGVVMAQTGKKVIIIDADLRLPTQHKIFSTSNNYGLTSALLYAETPASQHLQTTKVPGLRIMTSGPNPPNPAELLNSKRMEQILIELQEEADLLIFDSPPILSVTDAAILGNKVNGCLLVAEVGRTSRTAVKKAVENLKNVNLFGIVLNKLQLRRLGYYDYYYHYQYYSYDYSSRKENEKKQAGILARLLKANK